MSKIFNGEQRLFFAPKDDVENWKDLPILENSVQYSGYDDCPELSKSMKSFSLDCKISNPDSTAFAKLLGGNMQSQIDNAVRSSVMIESEPYIKRPKNLKYPNKRRKMRIWKKWAKRFGTTPTKQFLIPRAVISFKPEFKNNQLFNNIEIVAEKIPE